MCQQCNHLKGKCHAGNMLDESAVLDWIVDQKSDQSIELIDREQLFKYIETKDFLAVVFCKYKFMFTLGVEPKSSLARLDLGELKISVLNFHFQTMKKTQILRVSFGTLN